MLAVNGCVAFYVETNPSDHLTVESQRGATSSLVGFLWLFRMKLQRQHTVLLLD